MTSIKIFDKKEINSEEVSTDGKVAVGDSSLLPISITVPALKKANPKVIAPKYFNSFNFSKLAAAFGNSKMSIGITSANRNDGKTLVAANMAVSLASGYKQKTLLVDMNFKRPKLHTIFGTELTPGISEALAFKKMRVVPTSIDNLFLMTAGDSKVIVPGIEHTLVLRQVFYALKMKFDFVIIDMSSILPIDDFPIHFINEIDGLVSVIDSNRTKKAEFKKIFKHLDEAQFIGYIFNRVTKA